MVHLHQAYNLQAYFSSNQEILQKRYMLYLQAFFLFYASILPLVF